VPLKFEEDKPGISPPGIDGNLEQTFFSAAKGDHDRKMRELELGIIGKWLGGENNSPIAIAFICIVACLTLGAICAYIVFWGTPSAAAAAKSLGGKDVSFLTLVLGYIFGRGSKKAD